MTGDEVGIVDIDNGVRPSCSENINFGFLKFITDIKDSIMSWSIFLSNPIENCNYFEKDEAKI